MRRHILATTALALTLALPSLAPAQTPAPGLTTGGTQATVPGLAVETTKITTRPKALFEIPNTTPEQFDLSLTEVPGALPELVEGVTAKGYARYVDVEGARIGQVILTGVEKDGKREALPANAFTSQFELEATQVDPATEIAIEGDAAALRAALERLAGTPAPAEEVVEAEEVEKDNSAPPGGADRPANDLASSYETPEPLAREPDPLETVRVTTEGCPIRIDVEGMAAIQQTRVEASKDGAVTSEGSCADGGERYALNRSYTGCSDLIDLEAQTATAQYKLFYVDAGASRVEVSECAPDPEKAFPIVENHDACTMFLDYANARAVPQASLVYLDDSNIEVQVRGCQASVSRDPIPMVQTANGCSLRHDFAGGVSHRQSVWTYELDGILYQAGGCRDDGTVYAHAKVYDDAAGQLVCQPIVDEAGGTVTLQSRVRITVDGLSQFITDCQPDASSSLAIQATTDGCLNLSTWEHDLAAGVSYGQERFFYTRNAKRTYISECQRSAATYTHQREQTGWQNNDGTRTALPLNTVFINGPTGRYDVAVNTLLPGTIAQPYTLKDTRTVPTGELVDDGVLSCDVYRLTAVSEIYDRPDGSEYVRALGPGEPIGPVDACNSIVQTPVWSLSASSQSCSTSTREVRCMRCTTEECHETWCSEIDKTASTFCSYRGTRRLQREDGAIVDQGSSAMPQQTLSNTASNIGYWAPNPQFCNWSTCPSTWTGPEQIQWNQGEGW